MTAKVWMFRFFIAIWLVATPLQVDAGAWPRTKGEVFSSFSSAYSRDGADRSIYLEYGLSPRLTVGFDGFFSGSGGTSTALAFLRLPIGGPTGGARMAVSIALGQARDHWAPRKRLIRIGWHWGRGLGTGWLALDVTATRSQGQARPDLKADFTWGTKPRDRLMLIWQMQTGMRARGSTFVKFAPSLVWKFGAKKRTQIEFGAVLGLRGDRSRSLKLGLWQNFQGG